MKPSAILAFALLLSACGVARPILESDSTKVEVKTVVERVVDTAYVELPADITADVPICGGGNQMHPECDGMAEAHIENKVLSNQRRVMGFWDTGHDPFVYAFLVRDNNE